jgi:hypothetical protein
MRTMFLNIVEKKRDHQAKTTSRRKTKQVRTNLKVKDSEV